MNASNPFFHRGPVRDPAYFFGRADETAQILSLLANGQSVSVVGQRRVGKTSLLFHLARPDIFVPHGLESTHHLFIYIDCSGLSKLSHAELYRLMLEEIDDKLAAVAPEATARPLAPKEAQPLTYRAFERALRHLIRQNWRPTLMLDEFERLSLNPQLDPDFFSGLRALTAKYPIAYVTASKEPLLQLTYANASALSSPFFNIFASIRLGLFSDSEARRLLSELSARAEAPFSPAALDFILELAGPHPLFLQIAGFHAFDLQQATGASLTQADFPDLAHRFRASVEEHFTYYWRNLEPDVQRALATLPAGPPNQPDLLRTLEQACLIIRRDEGYDYLSSALARFIQAQPVAGLERAGALLIDQDQRQRQLFLDGRPLTLPASQYDLLLALIEQAGQVLSPEQLEQAVWGDEYIDDPERLKAVLKGLRRALGDEADRLENVRGVGYVWRG